MFEYTLIHWLTFLSAAVLLNLSPGPDLAFILANTFRGGRRSGFAAMFGIWSGALLHVILAAIGLSAILATSAVAFSIVKWVGAAYLVWLGLSAWFSRRQPATADAPIQEPGAWSIYGKGVLVCALNPKVAIFFLAFLPQFVVEGAGPVSAQLLLHGSLVVVIAVLIEPPLVLAGARLASAFGRSARVGLWMDRTLGTLFIALGVRLAMSGRG